MIIPYVANHLPGRTFPFGIFLLFSVCDDTTPDPYHQHIVCVFRPEIQGIMIAEARGNIIRTKKHGLQRCEITSARIKKAECRGGA